MRVIPDSALGVGGLGKLGEVASREQLLSSVWDTVKSLFKKTSLMGSDKDHKEMSGSFINCSVWGKP